MARQRIISPEHQQVDESAAQPVIRPQRLGEYVGQQDLVEKLLIALEAARQRTEPMEHVLLHGPPGLGKTTLAHVIANEMGTKAYVTSGPALTRAADLVGTLTRMQPRDILFIDEVHRLPATVEEYLYPAMEDFKIDFTLDSGMHARVITYQLQPFTLIGATTRAGLLTGAMRSRFGLAHHLKYYDESSLTEILRRACGLLQMDGIDDDVLVTVASRSRGTPRVALRLLRRVRDFSLVRASGALSTDVVADALHLEGVDELGLDELDRTYLRTLGGIYSGGPAGLEAIAASMNEDAGTLEDVVEPYLLQLGFLARTRQGRRLTEQAALHVNVSIETASLFAGDADTAP